MADELKNIIARMNFLKTGLKQTLMKVGEKTKIHLLDNWTNGKGGTQRDMKPLIENYKEKKEKAGRHGIPDLYFTGDLWASMSVKKESDYSAIVYPRGVENMEKLRGLIKKRPNAMLLNFKFKDQMVDFAFNEMRKGA